MVLCTLSIQHTNEYAAIWQRDNKNSNYSLIEENAEIIAFEPLRFILLLNANLLPQKLYLPVAMYFKYRNNMHTPHKC